MIRGIFQQQLKASFTIFTNLACLIVKIQAFFCICLAKLNFIRFFVLLLLLSVIATVSFSQNTKGDKAARPLPRLIQKSTLKKAKKVKSDTRDISGRRLRTKNKSSAARAVIHATSPYYGRSKRGDRPAKPVGVGTQHRSPSGQAARNNVYPNDGPYVNNPSRKPRKGERSFRNARSPNRQPQISSRSYSSPFPRKKRVAPRSASRSFVTPGRKNVYWGKFSKGERAITKDISGRPLRAKNYRTPQREIILQGNPYKGRKLSGDRPYRNAPQPKFGSASKPVERAWRRGDISGKPIGKNSSKKRIENAGEFVFPRKLSISGNRGRAGKRLPGSEVRSRSGESKMSHNPIPVRPPGNLQGIGFGGKIKTKGALKGGGSISGRSFNNRGEPISVRIPTSGGSIGRYQGSYKRNQLSPGFTQQGIGFAGNIKTKRPLRGGGSISGRSKSNRGAPIPARVPSDQARRAGSFQGNINAFNFPRSYQDQGEEFSGFLKAKKPPRGASVQARKAGSYKGTINAFNFPRSYQDQGEEFSGFIKAKRPVKGGGSISGKLWNNKEKPIDVHTPLSRDAKGANYTGRIKRDYSYAQNPKANKNSLKKKEPHDDVFAVEGLQVKIKRDYKFVQNPKANKNSLKKKEPNDDVFAIEGLSVKVKQKKYEKKPNAKEGSLRGIGPSSASVKASEYEGHMKMLWSYKHNPSSAKAAMNTIRPNSSFAKGNEFQGKTRLTRNFRHNPKSDKGALKVLAPGKAYARLNNYQGNSKMSKVSGHNLHPDAKFAHGHQDNVKNERTILTNVKLFWSKMFKKNDNQPAAVKEKVRRPRYDKKERELWKDLYD